MAEPASPLMRRKNRSAHMRLFLLIFTLLLGLNLQAQELLWEQTIGGTDTDWLQHAFENREGNYVFSGYSHSGISGDKTDVSRGAGDFWIIETDKEGNLLWQKTIGGSSYDMIFETLQLRDDSYLLTGSSYSGITGEKTESNRGDRDLWLVKLDQNKNIEWQKTYGGSGTDVPDDIVQTEDGGFLVIAQSTSPASGDKTTAAFGGPDLWMLKLDSTGAIEWQKSYGGNGIEIRGNIVQQADGNFVIGASSSSNISGNKTDRSRGLADYWIFEITGDGDLVWQRTIGGDNGDYLADLLMAEDGGFVLLGDSGSGANGEKSIPVKSFVDLWVLKLNSAGEILWQNTYAGKNQTEWAANISPSADSGYIISAMSASGIGNEKTERNRGDRDFWMLKINESGDVCWDKTLGGAEADQPSGGFEDIDGNYILGGWTDSGASGDKSENLIGIRDFWITKVSPPDLSSPVVTIPDPIKECDRNGNGFTEFDLEGLDRKITGDQENLEVKYCDHDWNPLPSPLPEKFRNTVKDGQVINVVVSRTNTKCSSTEFQLFLHVEVCEGDGDNDNVGFPKFFTPNNDGHSDSWKVQPETAQNLSFIQIYDRYGKLLKELQPHIAWDGIFNGKEMPSDDYWFFAKTLDNEIIRGHFSLIRRKK